MNPEDDISTPITTKVDPLAPNSTAENTDHGDTPVAVSGRGDGTGKPVKLKARRKRFDLDKDVKRIIDGIVTGLLAVSDGAPLTPHRIALAIKALDNLEVAPSTGAVTAVLRRWVKFGYVEMSELPFAFKCYTPEASTKGLTQLMTEHHEKKNGPASSTAKE